MKNESKQKAAASASGVLSTEEPVSKTGREGLLRPSVLQGTDSVLDHQDQY